MPSGRRSISSRSAGPAVAAQIGPRAADQRPVAAAIGRPHLFGPTLRRLRDRPRSDRCPSPRPTRESNAGPISAIGAVRARRRTDQPQPQPVGLFQQLRRRQPLQPDGVESDLLQARPAARRDAESTRGNMGRSSTSSTDPTSFTRAPRGGIGCRREAGSIAGEAGTIRRQA